VRFSRTRFALILGVLLAVLGFGTYWLRERRECQVRDDVVREKAAAIKRALPPGKTREDVNRYFATVGLIPDLQRDEIKGTFYAKGCSPGWYCGDSVLLGITIKFDASQRVISTNVMTMFNNCL
jgi:hypothetical protein